MNKVQKKVEEQAQSLKEKREQCTQLESSLKECKDKLMGSEQRIEQLECLNKVCVESYRYAPIHTVHFIHAYI